MCKKVVTKNMLDAFPGLDSSISLQIDCRDSGPYKMLPALEMMLTTSLPACLCPAAIT